jgi:hypothetical protein
MEKALTEERANSRKRTLVTATSGRPMKRILFSSGARVVDVGSTRFDIDVTILEILPVQNLFGLDH